MSGVTVIQADSFKPELTTVSFDVKNFENMRVNNQLYGVGRNLFELRGDIIHKTQLPSPFDSEQYPLIADIFASDWDFYFPDLQKQKNAIIKGGSWARGNLGSRGGDWVGGIGNDVARRAGFQQAGLAIPSPDRDGFHSEIRKTIRAVVGEESQKFLFELSSERDPVKKLRYLFENNITKDSVLKMAKATISRLEKMIGMEISRKDSNPLPHYKLIRTHFSRLGIGEEDIYYCIKNGIRDPEKIVRN
jgi:hypothetical protein